MALHMRYQDVPGGSFTTVDLVTSKVAQITLKVSYQSPSVLSWIMYAPNNTQPLHQLWFIQFWDDAGTSPYTGTTQSSSAPLFEGFIEECQPGDDGQTVKYTALDPTRRASVDMMLYTLGYIAGTPPTPFPGGIPRMVFNVGVEPDDDYTVSLLQWATMGQIMRFIFDSHAERLEFLNAGPDPATDLAYKPSDLFSLTYVPQDKQVLASESIRPAMERMLGQWEPAWRMLWYPGSRQWRFGDITQSPETTLTINDFSVGNTNHLMSLHLDQSIANRATAVKYYGPEKPVETVATLELGGLTWIDGGNFLQNDIATCCNVPLMDVFQITDPLLRPMLRKLQLPVEVQIADFQIITVDTPVLLAYYDSNTRAGFAGWRVIPNWDYDSRTGMIYVKRDIGVARYNANPNGGEPNYENPDDVKLIYATLGDPITVRWPLSGFEGTCYDDLGMSRTHEEYQEWLAVDRIANQPITTAMRLQQGRLLARRVHAQMKDIVYTGTAVLDGLKYAFGALDTRINLAGVDGAGDPVTTGWEAIGAMVTDVEYNFSDQLTTLQFSSNKQELAGLNMDVEKERLRIVALQRNEWTYVTFGTTIRPRTISDKNNGFSSSWNIHETWMNVDSGFNYYDPKTNRLG